MIIRPRLQADALHPATQELDSLKDKGHYYRAHLVSKRFESGPQDELTTRFFTHTKSVAGRVLCVPLGYARLGLLDGFIEAGSWWRREMWEGVKSQGEPRVMGAQGMALAQRTDDEIGVLKSRHFTPSEARVPRSSHGVKAEVFHMPVSLAAADVSRRPSARSRVPLDGFLLLESTGMGLPEDARQAQLADRGLGSVVAEDLAFFTGLIVVDVSENFLDLGPFGELPRLKELRIACNNIQRVDELFGFEHLMFLDISYNNLTTRSVQSLDVLPNLKDLDLSGNNLRGLPYEMYRFRSLERLIIDNNKIDDNNTFSILCTVPNLRFLSAAYNFLWKVAPECCAEGYFRCVRLSKCLDL